MFLYFCVKGVIYCIVRNIFLIVIVVVIFLYKKMKWWEIKVDFLS